MQAHGQIGVRAQYYMIPDLPPSCTDEDRVKFYDTLLGNLQDQSSIHVNWHTHRQNPSTCWICDMYTLSSKVMLMADKYITKSPLDIETELSSEDVSDSEIENENDLNHDDEGLAEYDIVESDKEQE